MESCPNLNLYESFTNSLYIPKRKYFPIFHTSCLKSWLLTMPKRKRNLCYCQDQEYCKRRRYATCSSPTERAPRKEDEMDTATEIRTLNMRVDILQVQINLLRNQVHNIPQDVHIGQETQKSSCCLM